MTKKFNLVTAFKEMFKRYSDFKGRSRRSEYWFATLAYCIIALFLYIITSAIYANEVSKAYYVEDINYVPIIVMCIISIIFLLITLIPALALTVRRLHDIGKSGWFILIGLIPYVGEIILFVLLAKDSVPEVNQYGPCPKDF